MEKEKDNEESKSMEIDVFSLDKKEISELDGEKL